jgi:predicted RNA binding protein YcfA (HicA-like mRNA interferase family)
MKGFYRGIIKILKKNGFKFLRGAKGSHEIWYTDKVSVIVPYNLKTRSTANSILKKAGIDQKV